MIIVDDHLKLLKNLKISLKNTKNQKNSWFKRIRSNNGENIKYPKYLESLWWPRHKSYLAYHKENIRHLLDISTMMFVKRIIYNFTQLTYMNLSYSFKNWHI